MAGHESITITMDIYKGTATTDQLADSIMSAASNVKELQQAVNAGAGIMQETSTPTAASTSKDSTPTSSTTTPQTPT